MRLKKLEIAGFKSFKDKTQFNFSEGISAIIGPNGCGKSNVVDAIRWVMGEQRVSTLRGKKMGDVIFNGSDTASAVGMAEVSIIFEKNGRTFPSQYAECSEIMISRRLFRDGESEYSINKVPCRLLDVREFFMDSGVGSRTYSIVEQESISKLIEAKPEDIREFIEEAAGIKKYKSRKDSAVRKMESTRQNIDRLKDITKEVRSQMISLSRQAKRAERFKELRKNIKEAELALSMQAYHELSCRISDLRTEHTTVQEISIRVTTASQTLDAQIEEIKTELVDIENHITKLQETFYDAKNTISVKEQKIEFYDGKIADVKEWKEKNIREIDALRERRGNARTEAENLKATIIALHRKIEDLTQSITGKQEESDRLTRAEKHCAEELEQEKSRHFHIAAEIARLKNLMASLIKGAEDLKRKTAREMKDLEEQTEKLASTQQTLASVKTQLGDEVQRCESLRERKDITKRKIDETRAELDAVHAEAEKTDREISQKSSRLTSLKEFHEGYEWCNAGTKSILQATRKENFNREGIYGLVADHIQVPKEYEVAVEAVLGEKLQYVVVKSQEDGIEAIDYLKKCASGRSHFVPLEVRYRPATADSIGHLEGMTRLSSCVEAPEHFRMIMEFLLGDVLLIPDLTTGISLWQRNGFFGTFVTPEGDVITPHGTLTGGSETNGNHGLLRNKRELVELEEEVKRLSARLATLLEKKRETSAFIVELTEELDDIRTSIHGADLVVNSRKKDIERLDGEITWIEQRMNVLAFNKESLESEEREANERRQAIETELTSLRIEEKEKDEMLLSIQEKWETAKRAVQEHENSLTDEKILLTSLEEKRKANIHAEARVMDTLSEIEREIEETATEIETAGEEVSELEESIHKEKTYLEHLYTDHEASQHDLEQKRELLGTKENILRSKEALARDTRVNLDTLTKNVNKLQMEMQELIVHKDTLKKNAYEKFQANLESHLPHFSQLEDDEIESLRDTLNHNKKVFETFGEVNLLALTEYEELKERYDFLSNQIEDLNTSLDTLQKTITRMNRISKKRFADTFEAINQSFEHVFPRLFPGGKGKLRLTDESDLLETGVDIDLQIPGKKRQNISLLSGGEKAMSAVSLIFAILMHKPSPFLILDEVDAALDDTNVTLFKNLLREIAEKSQIIVVTHNKKSMEIADNLFGVTMAKNGITSTVSVSLN